MKINFGIRTRSSRVRGNKNLSVYSLRTVLITGCAFVLTYLGLTFLAPRVFTPNVLAPTHSQFPRVAPGAKLEIQGVHFGETPYSLVLVTSPKCAYCTASVSKIFHQELARAARECGIPLYIGLPTGESSSFLELGVAHTDVAWKRIRAALQGTPTIILVNHAGIIIDRWAGVLPQVKASEVLARLRSLPKELDGKSDR